MDTSPHCVILGSWEKKTGFLKKISFFLSLLCYTQEFIRTQDTQTLLALLKLKELCQLVSAENLAHGVWIVL